MRNQLVLGSGLSSMLCFLLAAACGQSGGGQGGAGTGASGSTGNGSTGTTLSTNASSGAGGAPQPSSLSCDPIDCGASNGKTTAVPSGSDLQAAIDAAQPGDTLVLDAGATYSGHFVLPEKTGAGCVTIRTSTPDASLPADLRVTPQDAPKLARIVTPGGGLPAIATQPRAHQYHLIGLEIAPDTAQAQIYEVVDLGGGETSASDLPHDLILDRVWVHGFPNVNMKRGVALNSARTCIIHSDISDFHSDSQDAQAIGGHNGSGPFRIMDNHLESSTENILFGGAVPTIANLVPTDIVVRGNHFTKTLAWKQGDPANTGYTPWVKNLFELKNAQDVVLDGNVMENNWVGADQHGSAIVLTPRSEGGAVPWAVVQNVTITNNVILHVGGGVEIAGMDSGGPVKQTNHVVISNNLIGDIRQDYAFDIVRVFQFSGIDTLTIDHNTFAYAPGSWPFLRSYGTPTTGFSYTNNVVEMREGAWSDCGNDAQAVTCSLSSGLVSGNLLIGGAQGAFPAPNQYPATVADVGFVDYAGGIADFHGFALAASSAYQGKGTDGKAPGIDAAAIDAARK